MSEWYCHEKDKDFNELRLGQLTIKEFVTKFINLQGFVPYSKYEKQKYMGLSFVYLRLTRIKLNLTFPRLWMKQLGRINCAIFYLNKDQN